MGDKSPKSKERGQKQKTAAREQSAGQVKSKQDSYNQGKQTPARGRK